MIQFVIKRDSISQYLATNAYLWTTADRCAIYPTLHEAFMALEMYMQRRPLDNWGPHTWDTGMRIVPVDVPPTSPRFKERFGEND